MTTVKVINRETLNTVKVIKNRVTVTGSCLFQLFERQNENAVFLIKTEVASWMPQIRGNETATVLHFFKIVFLIVVHSGAFTTAMNPTTLKAA